MKPKNSEEKLLKMALAIAGIDCGNEKIAYIILKTVEKLKELGAEFSISDTSDIITSADEKFPDDANLKVDKNTNDEISKEFKYKQFKPKTGDVYYVPNLGYRNDTTDCIYKSFTYALSRTDNTLIENNVVCGTKNEASKLYTLIKENIFANMMQMYIPKEGEVYFIPDLHAGYSGPYTFKGKESEQHLKNSIIYKDAKDAIHTTTWIITKINELHKLIQK